MRDHAEIHHDMEGQIGDLELSTLMGDARDEMLNRIKHLKATWGLLSQAEQAEVANGLELFTKSLIQKMVGLFSKHEFEHAVVTLHEFKVKGGKDIEAKITCPNIQVNRDALGDRTGDMCMLVMVDSETFFGERAPVKTDPDQTALDLDNKADVATENGETLALPKPDQEPEKAEENTDKSEDKPKKGPKPKPDTKNGVDKPLPRPTADLMSPPDEEDEDNEAQ